jgi:NAD(P)-dependent dehydrogenase (short-subunit alcohol dehydrogenase family)
LIEYDNGYCINHSNDCQARVKYWQVTVNVVSPGLVQTDASATPAAVRQQIAAMTTLQRVAVPDDVSDRVTLFG